LIAKREGGKKETNLSILFVAAIGGLQNSAHFLTGQKHRRKKKKKNVGCFSFMYVFWVAIL
jgi:hypothetical protein